MAFSNTSILVNQQVPEFIREEYPIFIQFLKAYYEFLEQEQFDVTTGLSLKNNLTTQLKDIRNVVDVDKSIEQFEDNFFNTFLTLVPKETQVDKEFLVKNILPLYLAKGADESFKLLFNLLYGEDVEITFPKDNILRASDGKWEIENSIQIESDVRSVYIGNGASKQFSIAQSVNSGEILVYVNDTLKQENVDYEIRKESKKIIFTTAPTSNSSIEVEYKNFDYNLLKNRRITGQSSGASAIVERAIKKIITTNLSSDLPFELFINPKTIIGSFQNGEELRTNIIDSDGNLIEIHAITFSVLTRIDVIDGGKGHNVGDPVLIFGGGPTEIASAEVEDIQDIDLARTIIDYGGAGFKIDQSTFSGVVLPDINDIVVSGYVDGINVNHYTANSFLLVGSELIETYKNVTIDSGNYGMSSDISENSSTRIVDALSKIIVNDLGPITNSLVVYSTSFANSAKIDVTQGALYTVSDISFDIKEFKSIGRIDVNQGGINYKVGDEVIFSNTFTTYSQGAAAAVKNVAANGAVTSIQIQPPRINGTANVLNNSIEIFGTNTNFLSDLSVGDKITIRSQENYIGQIISDTWAQTNVALSFTDGTTWANNSKIGSYAKGIVGGTNYVQNNFPNVSISSATGSGANIAITSLMSDGENIRSVVDQISGKITSIKITTGGSGYKYIPKIDLSQIGDGRAVAEATLGAAVTVFPGKWKTTDSILSNYERRMQGGAYYFDFSYITSSAISFTKYKDILKQLLHPAGFINFAVLDLNRKAQTDQTGVISYSSNTISGTISTNSGSIFITGNNTKFNIANTRGILTLGSNIAVNGVIRTVNSIISNTNLSVSSAFTTNSNGQTLIILT